MTSATRGGLWTRRLIGVAVMMAACAVAGAESPQLEKLGDAELITEYEAAGFALEGSRAEMTDEGPRSGAIFIQDARFLATRLEIFRRGSRMVPLLIAFLEQEAPRDRRKGSDDPGMSLTTDVLDLLVRIGDTRAAPVALRIVEGWNGRVNQWERAAALSALERLTRFSFHKVKPFRGNYADTVEHAAAVDIEYFSEFATPARLYKQWMKGEGRDPSKWAGLATRRARQLMEDGDLDRVYCAAVFLRPFKKRDDDLESTLARLAGIVATMKKTAEPGVYEIDGKPVPLSYGSWFKLMADYGPRARPYATTLLRIKKEQGFNDCNGYAALREVGGREIVAFLFETLPTVSAEADRILTAPDAPKGYRSDDPRLGWISSQRDLRSGIDRWAGRLFDSDADRQAWWEANKDKSPEEWLAANLDVVADQVDKGVNWAIWIGYEVLPDLPGNMSERSDFNGFARFGVPPAPKEPFAVKWLEDHRPELRYDENAGAFRLMR